MWEWDISALVAINFDVKLTNWTTEAASPNADAGSIAFLQNYEETDELYRQVGQDSAVRQTELDAQEVLKRGK